jgi:SpoIVB peptidase S55
MTRRLLHTLAFMLAGSLALAAAGLQSPAAPASTSDTALMPASDLRPGMVGVGRTVFDGTRVEEFKVHILGVLENVMGPDRRLILARLEGGPLADTGVIAGMSGSPVYVDGRLIGAVSYSLGAFSKEPIAGITPIEEMTDAVAFDRPRPAGARVRLELPLQPDNLIAAFRRALNWNRPFADRAGDSRLLGVSSVAGLGGDELGTLLRPIATPLIMSGFEPDLAATLGAAFRDQGFVPMAGAAAARGAGEMPYDGPLKPGDAVGVELVNGDLIMGGTGTVTHIEGDRVYAFGHPLYNLGPTEFPMTRAYVYTVLPSLASSMKLSTTGEVVGTFLQDRATAIAGRLGPGPKMIPVSLTLKSDHDATRTFHFGVVRDQLFTPLMTYATILNTLGSYERQMGSATFEVTGHASLRAHEAINFDNLFSGDSASVGAASYIVGPITFLMDNQFEPVDLQGVDVTITASEEPRSATLERVWLDDPRPRAGQTVPLKVLLRTYRGEDLLRTVPIEIPANAAGTLSLVVSDGARLEQTEQRESRSPAQSRDVAQTIRALNKGRRNDTLYVRLMGAQAGAVVGGERLPALPPSVLAVLESDRRGGSFSPLYSTTLGEWTLPIEHTVTGSRTLSITVSPN